MTRDIEQRKDDHLKLAQNEALRFSISAGFQHWRFIHNALPEINLAAVNTSTTFLGKRLSFPLLISSMSGGSHQGSQLNNTLALAAESVGCALGVGSIRAALEQESVRDSFLIAREKAPTTVLLANIGLAQIKTAQLMEQAARFCEALQADGLIIHLNPLQEAFQAEGEPQFKDGLAAITRYVKEFPLPVIVKEVGQGLSLDVIQRLVDAGVQTIDIAGAGGTNWIAIESARLGADQPILKMAAQEFSAWGEPTAEVLEQLHTEATVIASGGLTRPLDLAKALALGADLGAAAGPFLKLGLSGDVAQLIELLKVWRRTLELAMFGTGISRISEFIGNLKILSRVTDRESKHE